MEPEDLLRYLDIDLLSVDGEALAEIHVIVLGAANLRLQASVHDLGRLRQYHDPIVSLEEALRLAVDRLFHETRHLDDTEVLHGLVPLDP